MTLRRDLLGFTAGAVVARTIMPVDAGAEIYDGAVAQPAGVAPIEAVSVSAKAGLSKVDIELVAMAQEVGPLAAEVRRNVAAFLALPEDSPDLQRVADLNDDPCDRLDAMTDRALQLNARTLAGFIAKAHLIRHQLGIQHCVDGVYIPDSAGDALAMSLSNDLLALEGREA